MNWILSNRKTGKSRSFKTLETAREATSKAAAKHGVRWVSLRPTLKNARWSAQQPGRKEVKG